MKYSHINRILVAEDQAINMEVVKRQITRVGLLERTAFYYNG
jgi:CheY-like chemotaxis protein